MFFKHLGKICTKNRCLFKIKLLRTFTTVEDNTIPSRVKKVHSMRLGPVRYTDFKAKIIDLMNKKALITC